MNGLQFQGNAQVYLQGQEALEPVLTASNGHMVYYVGRPDSLIRVEDYRSEPNRAAKQAITSFNDEGFADVFNQPAWVEIYELEECTKIVMFDGTADSTQPILWLGVWESDEMNDYTILWETMRSIGEKQVAFAILVE